jgi:hypothetical protein
VGQVPSDGSPGFDAPGIPAGGVGFDSPHLCGHGIVSSPFHPCADADFAPSADPSDRT